jgi:hypothetical protein
VLDRNNNPFKKATASRLFLRPDNFVVKYTMKKLIDSPTPILFVQYPVGAGGWFLTSLLYTAYHPLEILKHNSNGSGHDNNKIMSLNNFEMSKLEDAFQSILYQTESNMSCDDKIEYIRNTLINNPHKEEEVIHTIPVHCQDINVFLQAFPNSKAIQITIKNEHISLCTFNFIHKVLRENLTYFEKVCNDYGKKFEVEKSYLENINLTALENLKWINKLIDKSNIKEEIVEQFDSRVLTIEYDQYIKYADAGHLISYIGNFLQAKWSPLTKHKLVDELELYRTIQPTYPQT